MNPSKVSENCIIVRSTQSNTYTIYNVDLDAPELLKKTHHATHLSFDSSWQVAQVGAYVLQWSQVCEHTCKGKVQKAYQYKVVEFDPAEPDPLNSAPLQSGYWEKNKFWDYRDYYSTNPKEDTSVSLLPIGGFVLNTILTEGRGTFRLFNFDATPLQPGSTDPLTSYYQLGQGAFPLIKKGHTLLPVGNYVIDRHPDGKAFSLWSFDPQLQVPLSLPEIQKGYWDKVDANSHMQVIDDKVLEWHPTDLTYRLWGVDPESNEVLTGPIRTGSLPSEFNADTQIIPFQNKTPIPQITSETTPKITSKEDTETAQNTPRNSDSENIELTPGSIEFMRSKIKHVVYYMVESRSFDNVLGWLYAKGNKDCVMIGDDRPFDGASTENYNVLDNKKVYVSQYNDGKLSDDVVLMALGQDPFHNTIDGLQQMFSDIEGYWRGDKPNMAGFAKNNANPQVMETFSPAQLPVLNGLASDFAVSDEWFCSMPGGTDVNRGFSVTGSAYDKLGTWEGGDAYEYFPDSPHRQSIWKVLWNFGITDWKIYYNIEWKGEIFTNQLYLQGQIPSVDAVQNAPKTQNNNQFIAQIDTLKKDIQNGTLPAFSLIEPIWYQPNKTTSYHPGCDLVPAEVALNEIYEALSTADSWNETLLVITFDKNNGIYDHVPPPYAKKPWPNDINNGFKYDIMGPRVPTVFVSPWIKQHSVIRSSTDTPFDSTSFAATLLKWFGIPKSKWALGDRIMQAPTFEEVFQESTPRTDIPTYTPPYDKKYKNS